MSCDVNTRIKEDIYEELMETPLGDFIDMIVGLPGSNAVDNLTIALVDKKFEEKGI